MGILAIRNDASDCKINGQLVINVDADMWICCGHLSHRIYAFCTYA